jgi:hypothetical protein
VARGLTLVRPAGYLGAGAACAAQEKA